MYTHKAGVKRAIIRHIIGGVPVYTPTP